MRYQILLSLCVGVCPVLAFGAPPPISIPASSDENQTSGDGALGFLDGINRSPTLFGDMWGLRKELNKYGMTFNIQETSEYLGNTTGDPCRV